MTREVFEMVEIDIPLCTRVYGSAPCTAALGTTGVRKCYNLRATCQDPTNFNAGTPLTLRFCKPNRIPHGVLAFPTLGRVVQNSATVNVAGSDQRYSQLGRRATLSFDIGDLTYHERGIDPYVSERISGTAQTDEPGYNPEDRGAFLAKLKARWPNYQDASVRLIRGYLVDGAITDQTTYNYLMSEMAGPSKGVVKCQALGVLNLADPKKALCPKPSRGQITADMTTGVTSFTVTPTGIGAEYAASGFVAVDNEIMAFTRSGDVFTVTRAQRGTIAATHTAGATAQQTYSPRLTRIDEVARQLVQDFTATPSSYVTFSEWQAEVNVWAPGLLLTSDIVAPTSVATLLSELSDLGCTIYEDEQAAALRLRMNRPVLTEIIRDVSDRSAKDIQQEDRDEDRITQVLFRHKRTDPTKALTDKANYQRNILTVDEDATTLWGSSTTREIVTRWLDQGDDATVSVVSSRLLNRFKSAPKRVKLLLDASDKSTKLMDVIRLASEDVPDLTGKPTNLLWQVISRSEPVPYHEIEVEVQAFDFVSKYGFIMENTANDYATATDDEKRLGGYIVDETTLIFPDGQPPYRII